ncbi:ABC transporter permease [Macrococcus brunensis]|uniref:ABC transporter permease n=1 Tax=Macrococcus brunensis TaxID=198483 RepID=UPI001EF0D2C2|nr:ABC transporter permease [Macrococcus brunensis]ULG74512.1 ABC transporter permease [Macrococcus brunensis]
MNMNRIMAIAEKDFKEFMRNAMLLTMPLIPILLAAFYTRLPFDEMPGGKMMIAVLVVGMALGMVITSSMMTMLAEENEKHTLRGLINSPASMLDILLGKSLVVTIMTFISILIALIILQINIFTNFYMVIGFFELYLFFLLLGIGVGLMVKSVSETSLYLFPILVIFVMSPLVSSMGFDQKNIFIKIVDYLPVKQYMNLAENSEWMPILILFIWVLVAFLFVSFLFRKASLDQ